MHPLSLVQIVLWWLAPILQSAIAAAMFKKKLYKELPVFFGYTIFHVLLAAASYVTLSRSYTAYFYLYWTTELVDALLTFIVIQEIFNSVFKPYEALRQLGMMLYRWALLILIGVAIIVASAAPGVNPDRFLAGMQVMQRSTTFVQGGMLLFLLLFCRVFGLTWRNVVFGISLGFGVMACVLALADALYTDLGPSAERVYSYAQPFGFVFCAGIWLYYVVAPSSTFTINRREVDSSKLNEWNRALQELLQR